MRPRLDQSARTGKISMPEASDHPVFVPVSLDALVVGRLPQGAGYADLSDNFVRLKENPLGIWVPRQFSPVREMGVGAP